LTTNIPPFFWNIGRDPFRLLKVAKNLIGIGDFKKKRPSNVSKQFYPQGMSDDAFREQS